MVENIDVTFLSHHAEWYVCNNPQENTMSEPIRVVLADDHPLVRVGIRTALAASDDVLLVGEAADGEAALCVLAEHPCDVLLLDLNMPGLKPLDTVTAVRDRYPATKILVLSAHDDAAYVRSLVAAGVSGYVLKDEALEALVRAIGTVHGGGTWFSYPVIEKLVRPSAPDRPHEVVLTERDRSILTMIARGWDNRRIAADLHLAEQTVRNYISRLYDVLHVHSRAEAIVWTREQPWFQS
jgi:DNA-binding NarL/FixJ family response regulator